jgi:hypothetical protein
MLGRRGIGRVGRPGLVGTMARTAVVAGTATAVSGGMQRRAAGRAEEQAQAEAYQQQQQEWEAQQAAAQQAAAQQAAAAPPPAPAGDDVVSKLERLAALQQQGILTPDEFATQKARILAG